MGTVGVGVISGVYLKVAKRVQVALYFCSTAGLLGYVV